MDAELSRFEALLDGAALALRILIPNPGGYEPFSDLAIAAVRRSVANDVCVNQVVFRTVGDVGLVEANLLGRSRMRMR